MTTTTSFNFSGTNITMIATPVKEEWVVHPSGEFKIKKEDKCFCDDCYNYGVVEWKAMECFVCRDCAKTIIRNVKKFNKQWEK